MEGPFRRRGSWWQEDSSGTLHEWTKRQGDSSTAIDNSTQPRWQRRQDVSFPPPPRWRLGLGELGSEPLVIYGLGLLAALLALIITVKTVTDGSSIAAVLAPVMAVIGTFTGHAAGHSGAVRAIKEGRSSAQVSRAGPR